MIRRKITRSVVHKVSGLFTDSCSLTEKILNIIMPTVIKPATYICLV